jgi:predicted Zn-dependent protease
LLLVVCMGGSCDEANPLHLDQKSEIEIGRQAAADLEAKYGLDPDRANADRWNRLAREVLRVAPRQDLPWTFKVLNDKDVNAMSLPGGFVYATRGLMTSGRPDREVAGVAAHEIAHVTRRHSAKAIEEALGVAIILDIVTGKSPQSTQQAANIAVQIALSNGYRDDEYEADRIGTRYAHDAGRPAAGLLDFLRWLKASGVPEPSGIEKPFATHPELSKRISALEKYLPQLTKG